MSVFRGALVCSLLIGGMILPTGSALADRIDGQWCNQDRSLTIEGPRITTPGGNKLSGDYGRHDFSYTAPAGEAGAGARVALRLINDDNVEVRFGGDSPQLWRRCRVTS